jgi:hypothetical protein
VTTPLVVFTLTSKVTSFPLNSIITLGVTPVGIDIVAVPVLPSVTVVMIMLFTTLQAFMLGSNTVR